MEHKHVVNMHGLNMKGLVLEGKTYGPVGGHPAIEPLKEVQKKKLKNVGECIT